jgi:hypothetical protein
MTYYLPSHWTHRQVRAWYNLAPFLGLFQVELLNGHYHLACLRAIGRTRTVKSSLP